MWSVTKVFKCVGHSVTLSLFSNVLSLHYPVFHCPSLFFFSHLVLFIGLLISKNKYVEKSSEFPTGRSEGDGASYKAVDGIKDRNTTACKCCAATDHDPSWFHVDLGKDFIIESFEILGRLPPPNANYRTYF